jgi:hypothetical protein
LPRHAPVRSNLANESTEQLDGAEVSSTIVPSEDPFQSRVKSHGTNRYDAQGMTNVIDAHHKTVDHVAQLLDR